MFFFYFTSWQLRPLNVTPCTFEIGQISKNATLCLFDSIVRKSNCVVSTPCPAASEVINTCRFFTPPPAPNVAAVSLRILEISPPAVLETASQFNNGELHNLGWFWATFMKYASFSSAITICELLCNGEKINSGEVLLLSKSVFIPALLHEPISSWTRLGFLHHRTSLICGVVNISSHPTVAGDAAGLRHVFLHRNWRCGWHRHVFKEAPAPPSHRKSSNLPAPLSTFWLIAFWLRSSGQLESSLSQREGRQLFPSVRAHEQNHSEEIIALLEILQKKEVTEKELLCLRHLSTRC